MTTPFIGAREYFPGIGRIPFEGRDSDNPLAFKHYDANKRIGDKTMAEHLRFAVCYWHSFCNAGHDPFGPGTRVYPWDAASTPLARAEAKADASFEFFTKLGVPYYCFHDIDLAPDADDIGEYEKNVKHMVAIAKERQQATGMKLLWGTANLFSHPRYMNGASTNPDFAVVARAAVQVKAAIEATVELGGENYVFWGGREGYASLHNTNMKRELAHFGRFLTMARDYGRSIGFKGNYLIEPKPMEPMKHQYDFDSATVVGFLREHGLDQDFKLNIEANHATLSGHTFEHDLQVASDAGMLGSIDANRGNAQNGWDTDQFPTDLYDTVGAMLVVLRQGASRVDRCRRPVPGPHRRHGCVRARPGSGARAADQVAVGAVARRALCQLRQWRRQGLRRRQAGPRRAQCTGGQGRACQDQRQAGALREPAQPVPDALSGTRLPPFRQRGKGRREGHCATRGGRGPDQQ